LVLPSRKKWENRKTEKNWVNSQNFFENRAGLAQMSNFQRELLFKGIVLQAAIDRKVTPIEP